jgi:hypothetical protein
MDSSLSFVEGWGEAFELLYILMRLPGQTAMMPIFKQPNAP